MEELINNKTIKKIDESELQKVQANDGFDITLFNKTVDLEDTNRFEKIGLSPAEKIHLSALCGQFPQVMVATNMSQLYSLKFPDGIQHTLLKLKQGGYSSTYLADNSTKFEGTASLYNASPQAALFGIFTTMSIASGQFFLSQINRELKSINDRLDNILEFLYGDKKAELIAELNFVRDAYENYKPIMECNFQRAATITSLQESKKVAMKDLEFYVNDLETVVGTSDDKAFKTYKNIQLSMQLYIMSFILEIHYSQNASINYLNSIKTTTKEYIDILNTRVSNSFTVLKTNIENDLKNPKAILMKKKLEQLLEKANEKCASLTNGEFKANKKLICNAIDDIVRPVECIVDKDYNAYIRKV